MPLADTSDSSVVRLGFLLISFWFPYGLSVFLLDSVAFPLASCLASIKIPLGFLLCLLLKVPQASFWSVFASWYYRLGSGVFMESFGRPFGVHFHSRPWGSCSHWVSAWFPFVFRSGIRLGFLCFLVSVRSPFGSLLVCGCFRIGFFLEPCGFLVGLLLAFAVGFLLDSHAFSFEFCSFFVFVVVLVFFLVSLGFLLARAERERVIQSLCETVSRPDPARPGPTRLDRPIRPPGFQH